ncbi:mitochondrial distribution and morphology protein 10 [[Candida] jaroonii]|uniref:Mitochondrial distribution and morphology protein 10 n=1 Tax=[Candida] jaroonii TaxID=467808 RepID=A0ACA9Y3F1_9ASCO|nr:mitochondrial distribution and morphology protein 10 [[Candida] jaroonii]
MEYLQKCFYKSTGWQEENIFPNITSSSQSILDFQIPNGCKLDISSKTTDYSASSFTLSNYNVINGSLAYLYSSLPLNNTVGTKNISLQEAISGFKVLEPIYKEETMDNFKKFGNRNLLLYGRMYFPGSALESMVIKQLSPQTQLLIKSISNPNIAKNGTMIIYLQSNTPKFSREFVYSTNEALMGFRCLFNFGNTNNSKSEYQNSSAIIPKLDNSMVSIGTEVWYAAMTMSPGFSTAFRYSTKSTSTGKPLTMTLACNPILGQMSSTYTIKTSVASTFSSKYDFNLYSYSSNLSLGFELYNNSKRKSDSNDYDIMKSSETLHEKSLLFTPDDKSTPTVISSHHHYPSDHSHIDSHSQPHQKETVISAFQNLVNESEFNSVVRVSTSLSDKMLKLLWEGRFKDFLVSAGTRISINEFTHQPEFNKFGISFSYAN